MVTISSAVRNIIESKPMMYEALAQGIVSFANLAENIQDEVEQDTGNDAEIPAIVMAIRRYSEKIKPVIEKKIPFKFNSEIIMKTGLVDITLVKTPSALVKLRRVYELVDYEKGETLNVIQGNYEITIAINKQHLPSILKLFEAEKILNKEKDLVSLTMSYTKDFLYTPGIIAKVTRLLAWENINIFENISTMSEVIFIVSKRDAVRAYKALQRLIDEE